ncbi:hypothetical protein PIB30_099944 [Stylosanthes scabra]|uniref:Uncharacterized protein n=1 Tax=Stylosanthes scabra TaxID=79078 RepID=A0ABU6ZVR3_9FABA|nr:hypothetical protein [Stylosanthes scabra]
MMLMHQDSETESDTEEVQQERKSKRKEEESVINTNPPPHMDISTHDATIPELEPEPEPEHVMPVMQFGPKPEQILTDLLAFRQVHRIK